MGRCLHIVSTPQPLKTAINSSESVKNRISADRLQELRTWRSNCCSINDLSCIKGWCLHYPLCFIMYHVFQQPSSLPRCCKLLSVSLFFRFTKQRRAYNYRVGLFFFSYSYINYIIVSKMRHYLTAEFESLVTKSGRVLWWAWILIQTCSNWCVEQKILAHL